MDETPYFFTTLPDAELHKLRTFLLRKKIFQQQHNMVSQHALNIRVCKHVVVANTDGAVVSHSWPTAG